MGAIDCMGRVNSVTVTEMPFGSGRGRSSIQKAKAVLSGSASTSEGPDSRDQYIGRM